MKTVYCCYNRADENTTCAFRRGDRFEFGRMKRLNEGEGCHAINVLGHTFYIYPFGDFQTPLSRREAFRLAIDLLTFNFYTTRIE